MTLEWLVTLIQKNPDKALDVAGSAIELMKHNPVLVAAVAKWIEAQARG